MDNMPPELYTVREVAEIMRVEPNTIYNWVDKGWLSAVRIGAGRSIRIPAQSVSDMLTRIETHDSL